MHFRGRLEVARIDRRLLGHRFEHERSVGTLEEVKFPKVPCDVLDVERWMNRVGHHRLAVGRNCRLDDVRADEAAPPVIRTRDMA